jgi:hypothetical protein
MWYFKSKLRFNRSNHWIPCIDYQHVLKLKKLGYEVKYLTNKTQTTLIQQRKNKKSIE